MKHILNYDEQRSRNSFVLLLVESVVVIYNIRGICNSRHTLIVAY